MVDSTFPPCSRGKVYRILRQLIRGRGPILPMEFGTGRRRVYETEVGQAEQNPAPGEVRVWLAGLIETD